MDHIPLAMSLVDHIPLAVCARCKKETRLFRCGFNKNKEREACGRFLCEKCWVEAGNVDELEETIGILDYILCPDHAWRLKCKSCGRTPFYRSWTCLMCNQAACMSCQDWIQKTDEQRSSLKNIEDPCTDVCYCCAEHQIRFPIKSLRPYDTRQNQNVVFNYEGLSLLKRE